MHSMNRVIVSDTFKRSVVERQYKVAFRLKGLISITGFQLGKFANPRRVCDLVRVVGVKTAWGEWVFGERVFIGEPAEAYISTDFEFDDDHGAFTGVMVEYVDVLAVPVLGHWLSSEIAKRRVMLSADDCRKRSADIARRQRFKFDEFVSGVNCVQRLP
ncbi:hypothetical protein CA13_31440 [Planctomycetes bacterium CA13]|uniref:Uncharacterized protein n=1 Tax=Novipirellula herctigrandis TaxID=2527986 RepID=A0A5C5Z4C2_9BACT|nr:hypothetical protein CA13_31440 [Planctomycetes bacterium CA13]